MKTYQQRALESKNPTARALFNLMAEKKTNLCVAADFTKKNDLLAFAKSIGPEICLFKTHIDIVDDFDWDLVTQLQKLAKEYNFQIFEDRKFADIGNTVQHQYRDGIYRIAEWADIINAHTVPGPGIIQGLKEIGLPRGRGLLLLAEMTPEGNLAQGAYTNASIDMAIKNKDFVIGFITTKKLVDDDSFINMTPGIQFVATGDHLGQRYTTPEQAILEKNSDIIIVGRGIYQSEDPLAEAQKYRRAGWEAYLQRQY